MENNSTQQEPEAEACHHMAHHVKALSDGTLKGPMLWYTKAHTSYCMQCGSALKQLNAQRDAQQMSEETKVPETV